MAQKLNFSGPYQMRFHYTVTTTPGGAQNHTMNLNCDVDPEPDMGTPFTQILVKRRTGNPVYAGLVADAVATDMAAFLNEDDGVINFVELWKYEPQSEEATWVSEYTLDQAGVAVGATHPASQVSVTYRTAEGGIMKVVMLDTAQTPGTPMAYGELTGIWQDFADQFFADTTSYWLGADTSYPISCRYFYPGFNKGLWKERYRA